METAIHFAHPRLCAKSYTPNYARPQTTLQDQESDDAMTEQESVSEGKSQYQESLPQAPLRWLRAAVAALSIVLILIFFWSVKKRLTFPYAYDWIEDGILNSVRHIRATGQLYGAPSVHFTPFLYAPLYFYLCALVSHIFGISYVTLRLVSVVSTVGCLTALWILVYAETKQTLAALVAVSTFISAYGLVQFDGGHVDMLSLCLVMWAIVCSRRSLSLPASLLWVLAVQTKQGVLPIALCFLIWEWKKPKIVLANIASFFFLYLASIWFLNHVSQGWYHSYVFDVVHKLVLDTFLLKRYIANDLLLPYGIAFLTVIATLWIRMPHWKDPRVSFYLAGVFGMIAFTAVIRARPGSSWNTILPAFLWTSVLFGVSIGWLLNYLRSQQFWYRNALVAVVFSAIILQLVERLYSPTPFLPTADTLMRRRNLGAQLAAIPGPVLVASHPEEGVSAGKTSYAMTEPLFDVINGSKSSFGDPVIADYETLFRSGTLSALVLDSTVEDILRTGRVWLPKDTLKLFPLRVPAYGSDADQYGLRPRWIYFPCSQQKSALLIDPAVDLSPCSP